MWNSAAIAISALWVGMAFAQAGSPAAAPSGPQPSPEELQSAARAFAQQQWPQVIREYSALANRFPTHALSRFRIGVAQLELGQLTDAERNLREGERLGVAAGAAAYRLAQLHVEAGRPDSAVAQLLRSVENGFASTQAALEADGHLASLRTHRRWNDVLAAFDRAARPCMHDPRYREFDFWIGDWDVRASGAPPGVQPARNTITLEYNGCVVHEHWKPVTGPGGESFNIFDQSFGVWRQTWVDGTGRQHDYRGKLEGKNMVFFGELPPLPGQSARSYTMLTFFNISPDTVRQFNERSADGGKTWMVNYDLIYVRRKAVPE